MPQLTQWERFRDALLVLSRDRLSEITARLGIEVADRRSAAAHAESIARRDGLDIGDILGDAKRDELKAICSRLKLDTSGKEKAAVLARIATALGASARELTLTAQKPEPAKPASPGKPRARSKSGNGNGNMVQDYRHPEATRKNNPPAGLIEFDKPPPQPTKKYSYDPHLDPELQWSGKAEHTSFEVDTVSLHIQEQVSAQAILKAFKREDAQRSLFAQPDLPESKEIDFYQHEVGWRNRLVLGDSLLVMNSLLEREQMAGKVQCIYVDPPYGVKFNSNFQPSISKRDVKDGDDASLTREPEQIQAYRDTWTLGIHSYLSYLRDRLILARELLADNGSIFVQIGDENVHLLRQVMTEVFGLENCVVQIAFAKTSSATVSYLANTLDYILWFAKDITRLKYRELFKEKTFGGEGAEKYDQVELPDGNRRALSAAEKSDPSVLPKDAHIYRLDNLMSQSIGREKGVGAASWFPVELDGRKFLPTAQSRWKTNEDGMRRLLAARRIQALRDSLAYVRFLEDFPAIALTNLWDDIGGIQSRSDPKVYVVQTATEAVARCILMSTDPGDLVLDPTCGSGTTAFVAEQWGRRWITGDTSRVALAIARQRLLTAKYPFYRLRGERVKDGFVYRTVPHITLKSIAQNPKLDSCKTLGERERIIQDGAEQEVLYNKPDEDKGRVRVTGPFTVEAIPVAVMEDPDASPIESPQPPSDAGAAHRVEGVATNHIEMMLDLLRKTGVAFPNNKRMALAGLRLVQGPYEWLHAESGTGNEGDPRKVAFSFGPRHGPVTPTQVLQAIQETRGYDIVLFVGFALDPEAGRILDKGVHGRELHFVAAASDILVGDLLKTTHATKLFTVFGAPDIALKKVNGEVQVALRGVDLYNPNTGETTHDEGESVAAWFLDQDYDGKTFCICQAFFPGGGQKNPWEKLQRALKGRIDEEKFETLRGTTSLPFKPGKKIAVKVIDDRGNEVVKVVEGRA